MSEVTKLQEALVRYGFQVTTFNVSEQQIRITLRVPVPAAEQWKVCMYSLLKYVKSGAAWTVDPSRKYFIRGEPPHEKLFYIWRLIFQGADIEKKIDEIASVVSRSPRAKAEVTEIPLAGARYEGSRGKGASVIAGDEGVPAVARMALGRLRGG